jgi:hypothetical protein
MIGTYNVAGCGLNLQTPCWHTVLFTPAIDLPSELQAAFRTRRIGQTQEQILVRFHQVDSWDEWLHDIHKAKAMADMISSIDKQGNWTYRSNRMPAMYKELFEAMCSGKPVDFGPLVLRQ